MGNKISEISERHGKDCAFFGVSFDKTLELMSEYEIENTPENLESVRKGYGETLSRLMESRQRIFG